MKASSLSQNLPIQTDKLQGVATSHLEVNWKSLMYHQEGKPSPQQGFKH